LRQSLGRKFQGRALERVKENFDVEEAYSFSMNNFSRSSALRWNAVLRLRLPSPQFIKTGQKHEPNPL